MCRICRLLFSRAEEEMAQTTFTYDETRVIKRGPLAVVLKGLFGNRQIAVKKMDVKNINLAENEINILEQRDEHPNIVRYYGFRRDADFIYLALELCTGSLNEYVHSPKYRAAMPPSDVCTEIGEGLHYLHDLKIVHRNLKPSNILFLAVSDDLIMIKISDYSISKIMQDTESFTSSVTVGSTSWAAPEMLGSGQRKTVKADIYSLGRVFFFVLTNGRLLSRDLENLDTIQNGAQKLLIRSMTSSRADERPTAAEILVHPAFWNAAKTVQFIQALSNNAPPGFSFESYRDNVFSGSWTDKLDATLMSVMYRHRRYDGHSFGDLIRIIRNLTHHRAEMRELNSILGETEESLVEYFNAKFPNFLYYVWLTGKPLQNVLDRFY